MEGFLARKSCHECMLSHTHTEKEVLAEKEKLYKSLGYSESKKAASYPKEVLYGASISL